MTAELEPAIVPADARRETAREAEAGERTAEAALVDAPGRHAEATADAPALMAELEASPAFDELVDEMRDALADVDEAELEPAARRFVEGMRDAIARYDAAGEAERAAAAAAADQLELDAELEAGR